MRLSRREKREARRAKREALKENPRAWWIANPEKLPKIPAKPVKPWVQPYFQKRAAIIKADILTLSPDSRRIVGVIYALANRVTCCTGIPHHVDHHFPIARGGKHRPDNLRVITAAANFSKGSRLPA